MLESLIAFGQRSVKFDVAEHLLLTVAIAGRVEPEVGVDSQTRVDPMDNGVDLVHDAVTD